MSFFNQRSGVATGKGSSVGGLVYLDEVRVFLLNVLEIRLCDYLPLVQNSGDFGEGRF